MKLGKTSLNVGICWNTAHQQSYCWGEEELMRGWGRKVSHIHLDTFSNRKFTIFKSIHMFFNSCSRWSKDSLRRHHNFKWTENKRIEQWKTDTTADSKLALDSTLDNHLYKKSAWMFAAISGSHLSPLSKSFSLL